MATDVKFSEDVVSLGDMKVNPGKIVRRVAETGRPVLLTSHGRGVAVVQSLSDYGPLKRSAISCAPSSPAWPTSTRGASRRLMK